MSRVGVCQKMDRPKQQNRANTYTHIRRAVGGRYIEQLGGSIGVYSWGVVLEYTVGG